MNEINMVLSLLKGVEYSIEQYENAATEQHRDQPLVGYSGLEKINSKESIQRRIVVIREALLKISKSL